MAGNTRGRLKERFEGVHRNLDWSIEHCNQSIILLQSLPTPHSESTKSLIEGITALGKSLMTMDRLALGIYSKI
jgi:hypothetical protein